MSSAETDDGSIFPKIHKITAEIGAIPKTNTNQFSKYNFRSVAQAMAALQPMLTKHGVVVQPSFDRVQILEQEKGFGAVVHLTMTFWSVEDQSNLTVSCVGAGSDSGDKALAKAMACAVKYCIFTTFMIPEEGTDAEYSEPDVKPAKKTEKTGMPASGTPKMRDILG